MYNRFNILLGLRGATKTVLVKSHNLASIFMMIKNT